MYCIVYTYTESLRIPTNIVLLEDEGYVCTYLCWFVVEKGYKWWRRAIERSDRRMRMGGLFCGIVRGDAEMGRVGRVSSLHVVFHVDQW